MSQQQVLIVDDEADIRELLEITINRMGLATQVAADIESAHQLLDTQDFHLCLTDMRLPDGNGIDLVKTIAQQHPTLPVAVITAHGSIEAAIESLKAGAFDFLSKPIALEQLRTIINGALGLGARQSIPGEDNVPRLLGEHQTIVALREQIEKLARSQAPVYISGESGTGKELVARMIHGRGPRSGGPFIAVNCGAIPGELMESEFFGHVKGSFTGAREDKAGLFQAARGGTLFLDEVADLPLAMQVKLLRAIQEKAVRPVGGHQEIPVDCRILSATHKDLASEVEAERFRGDLFYRINVIQLQVPNLRQRRGDIPLLADFFLTHLGQEWGIRKPRIDDAALTRLMEYSFPGNIRELENILERAVTLCDGQRVRADDLQLQRVADTESRFAEVDASEPVDCLVGFLEGIEKKLINNALERSRWNKTEAAKSLGISFRALRYRLKKLQME